jgi:hypothetical protein
MRITATGCSSGILWEIPSTNGSLLDQSLTNLRKISRNFVNRWSGVQTLSRQTRLLARGEPGSHRHAVRKSACRLAANIEERPVCCPKAGKRRRSALSNTRRVPEWVGEELSPVRLLETNLILAPNLPSNDLEGKGTSSFRPGISRAAGRKTRLLIWPARH